MKYGKYWLMFSAAMRACFLSFAGLFLSALCAVAATLPVPVLPEPPEQRAKWVAPAPGIPSNLLSAASALFALGFPDPRGCEYHEIEVTVSSVGNAEPRMVTTHGWVLPEKSGDSQRYAICWNGLIYPVSKVGAAADLHADTKSLTPPSPRRFNSGLGEILSVFATNSPSSRVLLLLRCGESEAALRNWVPDGQFMEQTQAAMNRPDSEIGNQDKYDPFLEMAEDWAWAQFDRVLCTYMRGDIGLALAGARQLSEEQANIDGEAVRRGFPRPEAVGSPKPTNSPSYSPFLDQLPRLLADLERRARKPKQATIIDRGLTNLADASKRVEALIEDLDMVQVPQWSQPGMVMPEESPIVAALIAERDAAVEPLMDCLEHDQRLTRSVGFSRNFQRNRVVISVASAARAGLQQILHVQLQSPAEFRAYWHENKGLKLEERWYATLKNDQADAGLWLQAAENIVQPDNVMGVPGSGHYSTALPATPGTGPKFRGEILRDKRDPSVTELLALRAGVTAARAEKLDQFMGVDAVQTGLDFVNILAQWDKAATAVPAARTLMRRAVDLFADRNSFIMSSGHDLARYIPQFTKVRVDGGDTNALAEYAAWIKTTDPAKVDSYVMEAFQPLCDNAADPRVVEVSDWLFTDPASPWNTLAWRRAGFQNPVESDLIKLPAFRRLLVTALDKRGVTGSMQWQGNGVSYEIDGFGSGSIGQPWPESERPPVGTKVEVRGCDWIVWGLSNAKRVPFFNPFAPVEKRDAAVEKTRTWLEQDE